VLSDFAVNEYLATGQKRSRARATATRHQKRGSKISVSSIRVSLSINCPTRGGGDGIRLSPLVSMLSERVKTPTLSPARSEREYQAKEIFPLPDSSVVAVKCMITRLLQIIGCNSQQNPHVLMRVCKRTIARKSLILLSPCRIFRSN
jgi:hypothetical protein